VRRLVEDPSGIEIASPTGCAFAGADLDVLVVTSYGAQQLLRIECDLVGAPPAHR